MSLLEETITQITPQDASARRSARARLDQLTMPHWALGRLMDLAEDLAGMAGHLRPVVERRAVVIMAGDHGVASAGVSQYPQEVTVQMVANIVRGGAGINAMARTAGARDVVVDMGIASELPEEIKPSVINERIGAGTANIAAGPAMSRSDAVKALEAGIRTAAARLDPDVDLFGVGEMGIGNTTPSSAIVAAICGGVINEVAGRGSGIDEQCWQRKVACVTAALALNRPDPTDGIDVLARVGGSEIGGMAGLMLGAALAMPIVEAASRLLTEVATYSEAQVSCI